VTLWLRRDVIRGMLAEFADSFPLESGGVLMGYWSDETTLVCSTLIGPGPEATHAKHGFAPDHRWQLDRIAEVYKATKTVEAYLGDWHTHPGEEEAALSRKDRRTLSRIARESGARAPKPAMVVMHGTVNKPDIAGWIGRLEKGLLLPRLALEQARVRIET